MDESGMAICRKQVGVAEYTCPVSELHLVVRFQLLLLLPDKGSSSHSKLFTDSIHPTKQKSCPGW